MLEELGRWGCCNALSWASAVPNTVTQPLLAGVLSISLQPVTLSKLRRASHLLFVLQIYKAIYLLFLYLQNSGMIALKMTEMNIKQYQKLYQQKKSSGQKVDSSTSVTVVLLLFFFFLLSKDATAVAFYVQLES